MEKKLAAVLVFSILVTANLEIFQHISCIW